MSKNVLSHKRFLPNVLHSSVILPSDYIYSLQTKSVVEWLTNICRRKRRKKNKERMKEKGKKKLKRKRKI
jgi:hypothetical protein